MVIPPKVFNFSPCVARVWQFATGILLAKSMLSLEEIGIYELWIYLGLIISLVSLSGSYQAFITTFPKLTKKDKPQSIVVVWLICWLFSGLLVLIIFIFRHTVFEVILQVPVIDSLGKVLIVLLLQLNSALIPYIFLVRGMSRCFVPLCIWFSLGGILSIAIPLINEGDLNDILNGLLVWAFIQQIYLVFLIIRVGSFSVLSSFVKSFSLLIVPLTFYASSGMIAQVFDAWLVNNAYSSFSIFAIFKYGAREFPGAICIGKCL